MLLRCFAFTLHPTSLWKCSETAKQPSYLLIHQSYRGAMIVSAANAQSDAKTAVFLPFRLGYVILGARALSLDAHWI